MFEWAMTQERGGRAGRRGTLDRHAQGEDTALQATVSSPLLAPCMRAFCISARTIQARPRGSERSVGSHRLPGRENQVLDLVLGVHAAQYRRDTLGPMRFGGRLVSYTGS